VYCDNSNLDVYHKSPGYRRSKYRLRRYGSADLIFLERKKKRGGVVRKRRVAVPATDLTLLGGEGDLPEWVGQWFLQRVRFRDLRPACRLGYHRTAFMGVVAEGEPVRLTLDRDVQGEPAKGWEVAPLQGGRPLLPGEAVLELKFHSSLPRLFRDLLALLPAPGGVSKYRRCVEVWGLTGGASFSQAQG